MTRMQHLHFRNAMPFSDWLACVSRRLERRTGDSFTVNEVTEGYWLAEYHAGQSFQEAADSFVLDRMNRS